ncbi:hypothetical protein [Aidingimonas halophila]|uniref:YfhG lipoprotein n=1 Tax=Aidingimonas halophila TaxID=574349 RepID=A0A1H2V5E7_9GAMM|nr:hypothetical protein [Aidingimonas halophila]GHC23783.1 hypothetical protein GCM10008094_13300 [Aidingimonas halophila]SDW63541.1 hypothetical protein SAMN05443545_102328 [Aidingimonas halophila]
MQYRVLLLTLAAVSLAGCEGFPLNLEEEKPAQEVAVPAHCDGEIPTLDDNDCLVDSWIEFGLAAQRSDSEWRDEQLDKLDEESPRDRLARATVLAWGSEQQWDAASELLQEDLHAAPGDLQPLLRYWLNELEGRRSLHERLQSSEASRNQLANENEELTEKLDALTAIERSMNLRQQMP